MIKRARFNSKKNIKQSGFTLVELIVVIVIILVLAAVLVPSVLRYVAKSQEAKCKSGRSTLATEYALAVADGRIPWDITIDKETIGYYQREGDLPEFSCPMGGNIYALGNDDGTITIRCEYHDDGIRDSGGGGGESDLGQNLLETLKKFMEDNPESAKKNNTELLRDFYKKYNPEEVVKNSEPKKVITDDIFEKLLDNILEKVPGADRDAVTKALEKYRQDSYALAPFVCEDGKIIMYYAADDKWKSEKQYHAGTNLLYYNGDWYFSPNMNYYKTQFNGSTDVLPDIRTSNDVTETIKKHNLIKIS